jgi:hypothetical protein
LWPVPDREESEKSFLPSLTRDALGRRVMGALRVAISCCAPGKRSGSRASGLKRSGASSLSTLPMLSCQPSFPDEKSELPLQGECCCREEGQPVKGIESTAAAGAAGEGWRSLLSSKLRRLSDTASPGRR